MIMAQRALQRVEENLNCLVCLDTYTDPKLLQCHHIFCNGCLKKLVDRDRQGQLTLTCPTCRKVTPVPAGGVAGLQPAFHINHLLEILKEHKKATGDARYCPQHPTRELESFCETCEKLICLECVIEHHKGHECNLVSKLFEKYKAEIVSSLKPVEDRLTVACKAVDKLNTRYMEIFDQQDNLEKRICERARQIQEAAEARKVELINKLHCITGEKWQDLTSQSAEMETIIAQLSSYLDTVHISLETSSQGEVMKMKTTVEQQAKELTDSFHPDSLTLNTEADIKISAEFNATDVCQSFLGDIFSSGEPDPKQCHVSGNGIQVATVGEKSTAVLEAIDYQSIACRKFIPSLECDLVSELTGVRTRGDIQRRQQSQYEISYQPTIKGRHKLHIKISGQHIKGSPFSVAVKSSVEKLGPPVLHFSAEAPWGVVISQNEAVIVTEVALHVSMFSSAGEKLRSFNTKVSGHERFKFLCGITLDSLENILVTDSDNHCIHQFTLEGRFVRTIGTKGNGPLQFHIPKDIAFNATNKKIYVVDGNQRVQVLNHDFTFSGCFGRHGSGKGEFSTPWGIACDGTGKVYVADSDNHRIQVFTDEGNFLSIFGNSGEERERINQPGGIVVDASGMVYISQPSEHCISVFTCDGQFVTSFSTRLKDEELKEFGPTGLAVDNQGLLYVCDLQSYRVKIF